MDPGAAFTVGEDSKARRAWRTARPALPWWATAVTASTVAYVVAPGSMLTLGVLAVTAALMAAGVAAALGYRTPTQHERAVVSSGELWHLSSAQPEALTRPDGMVVLDPARCRRLARMLRSDPVWRRPRPAVFMFHGEPSATAAWANVGASRRRSLVVVPGHLLAGEVYVRWDGTVALPSGYRGPGEVRSLNRS